MSLPSAEDFRALLTAARDCGVTRCDFGSDGSIHFEMAPATPGERIVQQINQSGSADPMDVIRRSVQDGQPMPPVRDLLDLVANGARVIPVGNGDPTQAD